jgi:hypothetical protein
MHWANANAPSSLLCPLRLLLLVEPDEPQAAIASAQPTAVDAIASLRRWQFAALVPLALRNVVAPSGSVDRSVPGL